MTAASRATSPLRFVTGLASAVHALLALTCYGLHVRALLGEGLEKWVVVLCFVSAVPGMLAAAILLGRTGINGGKYPSAAERRRIGARLQEFTGSSSWPLAARAALAYVGLAVFLPVVIEDAHEQEWPLAVIAFFHVVTTVVLFHAFRWLGKTARPSDPIPSR